MALGNEAIAFTPVGHLSQLRADWLGSLLWLVWYLANCRLQHARRSRGAVKSLAIFTDESVGCRISKLIIN